MQIVLWFERAIVHSQSVRKKKMLNDVCSAMKITTQNKFPLLIIEGHKLYQVQPLTVPAKNE